MYHVVMKRIEMIDLGHFRSLFVSDDIEEVFEQSTKEEIKG